MTIIQPCPTSGPYGDHLRRAHHGLQDDPRAGSAVRLLDLVVHEGSEHTLSLAVRSLRMERGSTAETRFREADKRLREQDQAQSEHAPSHAVRSIGLDRASAAETRFREAAKRLRERDQAQDEVVARILELMADLVVEPILAAVVAALTPVAKQAAKAA